MRKGAIVAIIIIAICIIGGVVGFIAYNNMNSGSGSAGLTETQKQSSGLNLEIEGNDIQKITYGKSITLPGWTAIELPANQTAVTVDFYNPAENKDICYIQFKLKLRDTGETLYESGLVQPGDHKREITLTRSLAPGTYKAVVSMQPYSMDDSRSELNNADVELDLVVS